MLLCVFIAFKIVTQITVAELVENGVFSCRYDEFKCQNGTCIGVEYLCDGVQHCPDASDENFCKSSRKRPRRSTNCILPEYPNHGSYEVLNNRQARPGQSFNSLQLTVRCRRGYGVVNKDRHNGSNIKVFCVDGDWNQNMPQCVRYCRLDSDPSVRYMCHVPGVGLKVCGNYVAPGTTVSPVCNTPIYYSSRSLPAMKCVTGFWNYVAQCETECGRVTPEAFTLVIDGKEAKRGELPWHAGIYRKKSGPPEQICSGSLVSNNVVISAAHCFWNDLIKLLPASDYSVAVGKLHRSWDSERDVGVQKSDVKQIKIPSLFEGEAANFQEDIAVLILTNPFVYKTYIRPVCINFDSNFERWQLQQDNLGKVAGWGLTAANGNASPVLKVVNLPYISEIDCIRTLPPSFREYITGDKFCAGYTNGTALCKGDSGGGLAFAEKELGIDRYYLRGVVSAAPRNDHKLCNDNAYTTFTKITKHQDLINEALAESLARTCPFYSFQCDDRTCVDQGADCDGKQDCEDGSDESDELCRGAEDTSSLSDASGDCILPPYPDHGTYVVTSDPSARPGQRLDAFVLKIVCAEDYEAINADGERKSNAEVNCNHGVWSEEMPKCVQAACTWKGVKGKCVPSHACLSALDKTLGGPTPPACGTSNDTPLVCCTDCELVNDSRLLLSDPVLGILTKTGTSKAKDKCLEYLHTLDYPCKKDSSLRNIRVELDPIRNCHRKVIQSSRQRGSGRREALREEFPHMALLAFDNPLDALSYKCGGTVISERFILTAAHCLKERTIGPVKYIALGILKRSDPVELWQRYNVKRAIPYPEYKPPSKYHDIALVETDKEIIFNSAVLPACLHVDSDVDTYAYITGWGVIKRDSGPSDVLHSIVQMKFTNEVCAKQFPPVRLLIRGYDDSTQMCYGNTAGPDSPCQGDSGGPLQSQDHEQCVFTIVGVLSYGSSCNIIGDASIYARVKYYLPWIEDIVWS